MSGVGTGCYLVARLMRAQVGQYKDVAVNLKFGQASLLSMGDEEYLATHLCIEDGEGKVLTHRLRVKIWKLVATQSKNQCLKAPSGALTRPAGRIIFLIDGKPYSWYQYRMTTMGGLGYKMQAKTIWRDSDLDY